MGEKERKGWSRGGMEGERENNGVTRQITVHKCEIIKTFKTLKIKQQKNRNSEKNGL